jgi:hypothetical protein
VRPTCKTRGDLPPYALLGRFLLHQAVTNEEFVLHYQPKVDLESFLKKTENFVTGGVVDSTNLNTCREVAAKCRQEALSSADPEQWVRMAEMWEWLANAIDRLYLLARDLAQPEKIQKKSGMTNRASEACGRRPPPILREGSGRHGY